MSKTGTCRKCQMPVWWAVTKRRDDGSGGKRMPLTVQPHPDGNVRLTGNYHVSGAPIVVVLGNKSAAEARDAGEELHLHHRAVCTSA